MTVYLFLDFDGVLHKNGSKAFEQADLFAKAISNYDVKIVFSTSWREYSNLEKLKVRLPLNIQEKCVGLTPVIKEKMPHPRYHEIQKYLKDNKWIALDDMRVLFPVNCPELFLLNGSEGFTKHAIKLLRTRIENLLENNPLITDNSSITCKI